jgi:enolase
MKVTELIDLLKTLPQDYEVVAPDDDGCGQMADSRVSTGTVLTNHTGKKVHIKGDYFDVD